MRNIRDVKREAIRMTTLQTSARAGDPPAPVPVAEQPARATRGVKVLVAGIVAVAGGVALVWYANSQTGAVKSALTWAGVLLFFISGLALGGLTPVAPGQARVLQLFGKYRGTVREPGMQWVNPFTHRIKVSTRIRNHETAQAKVNDADGNPIEIAAVVVWQVADTAKAIYAVDEYVKFVAIQTETAVRHIASSYPYTNVDPSVLSLRDNAEQITEQLSAEIAARVASAGVAIIESRLTRLSYAAEIAQAMLRQQQASAVVGARMKIVEGAVGMVQLALRRLEEEDVVELDEERKAAMVSNLLVVLCSEQATQQVVNTGSLYQ
jgi:regulator of protease activity HflC (stomatin/prohibitin superfamily)